MPLFSRSAVSRSHRFSLRKHHRPSDAEAEVVTGNHTDRKARRQTQPTIHEPNQSIVISDSFTSKTSQAPVSKLSSSVRSSSSTIHSISSTLNENFLGGENDTEISEEFVTRDSVTTSSQSRALRNSRHSGEQTSRNNRNSLADYRQLQCSMSYKNRANSDIRESSIISSSSDSRGSERSHRMQSSRGDGPHVTNSPVRSSSSRSLLNARISETSTTITMPLSEVTPVSADDSTLSSASQTSGTSGTSRMTETNVAVLQTRRAFQQMVLALEDEDSGDDDDSDSGARRRSRAESSISAGVVRLGAEEYRMFQFRLRQLEELTAEQSRKQIAAEQTIEREVQIRTKKALENMKKQINMYKQAKEFECEREVQRRVSEHMEHSHSSRSLSRASRSSAGYSSSNVSSSPTSYNTSVSIKEEGRSFEKLLHPRRSRKRMEQIKVREEAHKREMEQFREFIRSTEMRMMQAQSMENDMSIAQMERAKHDLEELADPLLPESVIWSSPADLIDLICILRKNGREQEKQIDEARHLLTAAIEAREDAEATAREAVEFALMLDARLDLKEKKGTRQARETELCESRGVSIESFNRQSGMSSSSALH